MRSAKNKTLLYLSEPGIRQKLDGPLSDCKHVGVFPRAIAQNPHISSNQFQKIQNRRLADGKVSHGTIRKWELNTCHDFVSLGTEDFFVGRIRSKIYTM